MTQTWSPSFPDLTGWTQDPQNGVITPSGSTVELAVAAGQTAEWSRYVKTSPSFRVPIAGMGFTDLATLLIFDATFVSIGGTANTNNYAGITLWEDDNHFYGPVVDNNNNLGSGIYSSGGSFFSTGFSRDLDACPIRLQICWNNGAAPVVTDQGDTLAAGEVICYGREYAPSPPWSLLDNPRALSCAPTHLNIHVQNGGSTRDVSAVISVVTVTGPYLPTPPSPPTPDPNIAAARRILMDLYPPGAYPGEADRAGEATFHHDILTMDASALAQAQDAAEQLQLEIFPQTAEETLDEWEQALEIDTVATVVAERQALARDAAKSVQLLTPKNLRGMLAELLSPTYGWNDPGDQDRLGLYPYKQNGVGAITEDSSGMLLALTSPAQGDFANQGDPHALVHLVDRADGWTVEVQMAAATVGAGTATGLFISKERYGQSDALFIGLEDVGGGGVAIRAILYNEADGDWAQLATIATVGPPCWFQVVRSTDGLLQLNAGAALGAMASVVADLELTWTPRVFGLCTRNVSPWNTVDGLYQHLRIAYERQANNVQLYEYDTGQIPADDPERIFWAFVYRDPTEAGGYDLAGAQRIADRVKWGHTLILLGERNCFLCDDPFSLTERDILGA